MKKLALLFVLALSALSLQAGTITQTTDFDLSTVDWTKQFVFNQFDPTLGQLLSVQFILDGKIISDVSVQNLNAESKAYDIFVNGIVTLGGTPTPIVITTPSFNVNTGTLAAKTNPTGTFSGPDAKVWTGLTGTDSDSTTYTSDLGAYIGNGQLSLPVFASSASNANGAATLLLLVETKAQASATIIYNYEPIPEPATYALFGGGLLGLALLRRRAAR